MVVITPSFLRPRLCGAPGEVGEADRRHSGDVLDVIVRPGAMAGGDGFGQHAEHLAVRGGHADRDSTVDPCIAVDVVVLPAWPMTSAMTSAASLTVSASGPVGAYSAPAWASGLASVATATAAMSSASTKASAPHFSGAFGGASLAVLSDGAAPWRGARPPRSAQKYAVTCPQIARFHPSWVTADTSS